MRRSCLMDSIVLLWCCVGESMCAALPAEWWRGEYSNSIVYVVIDGTMRSWTGVGLVSDGEWPNGMVRRLGAWLNEALRVKYCLRPGTRAR